MSTLSTTALLPQPCAGGDPLSAHHLNISRLDEAIRNPTPLFKGNIDGGLMALLHSYTESLLPIADYTQQTLAILRHISLFQPDPSLQQLIRRLRGEQTFLASS
jgi:hypothetical protein